MSCRAEINFSKLPIYKTNCDHHAGENTKCSFYLSVEKKCYKTILIVNGVHSYDYRSKYVAEYNSPKEIILQTLWN